MSKSDEMQKPDVESTGLQLVFERNHFYRDCYKQVSIGFLILLFINFILAFTLVYHFTHPVQPKYFAATADGKILKEQPLSKPLLSDNQVTQWAADSVRQVFAQDFIIVYALWLALFFTKNEIKSQPGYVDPKENGI